jgi:hypothetical protein
VPRNHSAIVTPKLPAVYRLVRRRPPRGRRGEALDPKALSKGWRGIYSSPAVESDLAPAARLALDVRGELFLAGGGGDGLYDRTVTGELRFVESFRGEG